MQLYPLFPAPQANVRSTTKRSAGSSRARALAQIFVLHASPDIDIERMAARVESSPSVRWAEPNHIYTAASELARNPGPSLYSFDATEEGDCDCVSSSNCRFDDRFYCSSGAWGQSFFDLWGLFQIEAPRAWESSQGEGIVVAVIDTGIDIEHPDLAGNVWRNQGEIPSNGIDDDGNGFTDDTYGWDFTTCVQTSNTGSCPEPKSPGNDVVDYQSHGTHVAGTIAAVGGNGIGIVGVAPMAQVMAVKGMDKSGVGPNSELAEAIVYAAENGADIINASWSGPRSSAIQAAVEYATEEFDVVFVAAAGNHGASLQSGVFPANLDAAIAVGSTTHYDEATPGSNFGGALDLTAPGGGGDEPIDVPRPDRSILSLRAHDASLIRTEFVVEDSYLRAAGTSMSAAYVSGAAALVRGRYPHFDRLQVRQALLNGADDLGAVGWDPQFGYGRVNVARAMQRDQIPVAIIDTPANEAKIRLDDFPYEVRATIAAPGSTISHWTLELEDIAAASRIQIAHGGRTMNDAGIALLTQHGPLGIARGRFYALYLRARTVDGATSTDMKTFLVPNPRFAALPIPDPHNEGGFSFRVDAVGRRIVFRRVDRAGRRDDRLWIFDSASLTLGEIPDVAPQGLSPEGNFLLFRPASLPGSEWIIREFAGGIDSPVQVPHLNAFWSALSPAAEYLWFTTRANIDPAMQNADGSVELFSFQLPAGPARQRTDGPSEIFSEIQDPEISSNGRFVVFTSASNFDSEASTEGMFQVFRHDAHAGTTIQVTGRAESPAWGQDPTISNDGNVIGYISDGLFLTHIDEGTTRELVPVSMAPEQPSLSADGMTVAFVSTGNLDPTTGNEDRSPEIFLMDLSIDRTTQVSDFVNMTHVPELVGSKGGTLFVAGDSGELNGIQLRPSSTWYVPRNPLNASPTLSIASSMVIEEGETSTIELVASDPESDPIVFHAQIVTGPVDRLRDFASAELIAKANGRAVLRLTPNQNESGEYTLRVGAFDTIGGGVATAISTIVVEDTLVRGDADCNGIVDSRDIEALVAALFNPVEGDACTTTDANDDSRTTVADLPALVRLF